MYISIDMNKLRFLHKHASYRVVSNLDFICGMASDTILGPANEPSIFDSFTDDELRRFYTNVTAQPAPNYMVEQLKFILCAAADKYPESDASAVEADLQAGYVEKQGITPHSYKYVKGSTQPVRTNGGLFPIVPVNVTPDEVKAALLRKRTQAAPRTSSAPAATVQHTAPRPVRAVTAAPRSGGVREQIWKVADEMWEAEGKSTNKQSILHLRKKIMDRLEREGVKRTSSSNELGNWQKARVN